MTEKFPEVHVVHEKGRVQKVTWTDGETTLDLTPCLTSVIRHVEIESTPLTEVTFAAVLVEDQP